MAETVKFRKVSATVLVAVLTLFLIFALWPYVNALFGAVILYVLFRPMYGWLTRRGLGRALSAMMVLVVSLLIIMVPLLFSVKLVVNEVTDLVRTQDEVLGQIARLNRMFPSIDLQGLTANLISAAGEFAKTLLLSTVRSVAHTAVALIITYFVFYYLLVSSGLSKKVLSGIPFNRKNSLRLQREFSSVTYSVVISTGLIAVLQGALLAVGFMFFGIRGAVLWGFVGAILSFLPVVGPTIVWIPAGIIMLLMQDYFAGIGILIWGLVLSNVDNFIRPLLQRQIGKMHPLISLIGIFIGIPIFGILGLIIGPLLLSYFFLTLRMFREEYLSS